MSTIAARDGDPNLRLVIRQRWCLPQEFVPKYPGTYLFRYVGKFDGGGPNLHRAHWNGSVWRTEAGEWSVPLSFQFEWLRDQYGWVDLRGNNWPLK